MPLHRIYSNKGTFTAAEKHDIAKNIRKVYSVLPAFYVVVAFVDLDPDSFYVGNDAVNGKFVRIVTQHLARTNIGAKRTDYIVGLIQDAFKPYVQDRGLDWEIHIEEMEREGWRENGMIPPMPNTDAEKLWVKEDKPVEYDGAYFKE